MAIPQARVCLGIPYGSVNAKSNEYIPTERLAVLPSGPAIKKQLVNYNYDWWIDNRETGIPKFNKWLLTRRHARRGRERSRLRLRQRRIGDALQPGEDLRSRPRRRQGRGR